VKSLEDLSREVQYDSTLDDIVEAIIFKSNQTKIPKAKAFFQQTFYRLQQESPDFLGDFIFDESGLTPFSDELDSILFRLEASGVLHTLNPAYKDCLIVDSRELLQASYNKFGELTAEITEIDKCASLFSAMVKHQAEQE